MNEQEQRIAIAEACGLEVLTKPNPDDPHAWLRGYFTPAAAKQRRKSWPSSADVKIIPDYLNDLNAMHEAEKVLLFSQRLDYHKRLQLVVSSDLPESDRHKGPVVVMETCIHATAAQRAEAFLKCIGKWPDPYYELLAEDYSAVDANERRV